MAAFEDRADENDEIAFKDGNTDISQQLMDRYGKSSAAQHRHLVATAVAMRSILTSESLPPSPPAFFAAAISSVDSSTEDPVAVSALLTFLSIVVPLVPSGEISATMARDAVAVLVKAIDGEGDKLGVASLRAGVKCIGTLLIGFCDLDDWVSLQIGFALLLKFAIDKRPKVLTFEFPTSLIFKKKYHIVVTRNLGLCVCFIRLEDVLKSVWRSYLVHYDHLLLSRKQVIQYMLYLKNISLYYLT